jgi:hypothetical protein
MICEPLKNFGKDCYTRKYTLNSLGLGYIGHADTCLTWPDQDSCYTFQLAFVEPTTAPTGCTSMTDTTWHIPCTDEFSFILCGADNGANCCGIDITLTFKWFFGGTFHTCTRTYPCIVATTGSCNNGCGP